MGTPPAAPRRPPRFFIGSKIGGLAGASNLLSENRGSDTCKNRCGASANPQPPASQFPPYPRHHQYSPNHDVHPTPTSQNHIHRYASSTTPCQTLHPPTFMNDLSQNPQHHHQQQSSDLNISSCNISRNDPIISANDSYWLPNISYCTMSGERIPLQCSGDLGLSHNTPCNQASLPFQSSFFECASSQFSQRQSQNKKNNNKPLV